MLMSSKLTLFKQGKNEISGLAFLVRASDCTATHCLSTSFHRQIQHDKMFM